jgi:hypothetical protein
MLIAGPVSKMASQQKAFCVFCFEMSRSVITVQREFHAQFKKCIIIVWCVFFKLCTKLMLHCNHRSGHLRKEHTESLLLLRCHLGNRSRGPSPASRKRRQKGNPIVSNETVRCGHEFYKTWTGVCQRIVRVLLLGRAP